MRGAMGATVLAGWNYDKGKGVVVATVTRAMTVGCGEGNNKGGNGNDDFVTATLTPLCL